MTKSKEELAIEYINRMPKPPHDRTYVCHDVNTARSLGYLDGYESRQEEIDELKAEFRSAKNMGCDATCLNYRDNDEELSQLLEFKKQAIEHLGVIVDIDNELQNSDASISDIQQFTNDITSARAFLEKWDNTKQP